MKTALKMYALKSILPEWHILLYNLMLDMVLIYVLLLLKLMNKFA